MMKLSDGQFGVHMLNRMLQLLMILTRGKSHMYIHSIMMQLLVLLHQRSANTCAWQMLMGSLSTFNEEAGEMSFSLLARCILGDTQKRKFAHLNKIYQQIHFYGELERELGADGAGFHKNGNWRKKIDPSGEVVGNVAYFVCGLIRQIRDGSYRIYSGKPHGYRVAGPALNKMVQIDNEKALWLTDMDEQLDKQLLKCKEKFNDYWMEPYTDIWPEFTHHEGNPECLDAAMRKEQRLKRRADRLAEEEAKVLEVVAEEKHVEPSPRKSRSANVVNSSDDSDLAYSASSDSDEPQDAVPELEDDEGDDDGDGGVYHAGWSNIDPSNIIRKRNRERTGRQGKK
jgi:hypothetical protein